MHLLDHNPIAFAADLSLARGKIYLRTSMQNETLPGVTAQKSRKLILHIGAHKTGSSAIQGFLRRRRPDFLALGWAFCFRQERPLNWGHMFSFKAEADGARFGFVKAPFQSFLNQLDNGKHDIILSAEDLFFLDGLEVRLFAQEMAKRFTEITIVCYLRRQDHMAMSHWSQGAKTVQSALVFGRPDHSLPHLTPFVVQYLDYASKLAHWKKALPEAKMVVRIYDREAFPNSDVITDFLTATGLDIQQDAPIGDANMSFGATTVRFIYMLRAAGILQKHISRMLAARLIPITNDKLLPTRAEAEAFVDMFSDSNAMLPEIVGHDFAFDSDYSRYPETAVVPPLDEEFVRTTLLMLLADSTNQQP
ncbi:MAG: hypothetical protein ACOH2H_08705 [Cypionkella sp.]